MICGQKVRARDRPGASKNSASGASDRLSLRVFRAQALLCFARCAVHCVIAGWMRTATGLFFLKISIQRYLTCLPCCLLSIAKRANTRLQGFRGTPKLVEGFLRSLGFLALFSHEGVFYRALRRSRASASVEPISLVGQHASQQRDSRHGNVSTLPSHTILMDVSIGILGYFSQHPSLQVMMQMIPKRLCSGEEHADVIVKEIER